MSRPDKARPSPKRCAIYTRKSSEDGLEQTFNSLHAQREACEAFIKSQRDEGWILVTTPYDDGGFSGGTTHRPALGRLIEDIKQGRLDIIVVYKVDRFSRSLADFARLIELFDNHTVSFVSVTQQFNTSSSMGRLTLNVLLSFAQFEREVTGERIRDKIAASKKRGLWMGGVVPLGYDVVDKQLVVNPGEAKTVRHIFTRYRVLGGVRRLKADLDASGVVSKTRNGEQRLSGGQSFSRGALYTLLKNPLYIGKVRHRGTVYAGKHEAIVDQALWHAVQTLLSANKRNTQLKTLAKEPSLLAGRLFDDRGNPMSPSHAKRNSRRYRYYVSQALLQYRDGDAGSVVRVPAKTAEDALMGHLLHLLTNPGELLNALKTRDLSATQQQAIINNAKRLADAWPSRTLSDQIESLGTLMERITIARNEIRIRFKRSTLKNTLLPNTPSEAVWKDADDIYETVMPVRLRRCGVETRLIVLNDESAPAHSTSVAAIQGALAKALVWNQALLTGTASSMTELAKRENVTQRYIAHLIKLAFLAPDIIRSIVKGELPSDLSLDRLEQGFPLDWHEQRKALGFKP